MASKIPRVAGLASIVGLAAVLAGGQQPSSFASIPSTLDPLPPPLLFTANGQPPDASPPPLASAPPGPPRSAPATAGRFGLGLLIADRGNGRLLIVDDAKRILWRFPGVGGLPRGQRFAADDAFISPDGRTIVANDEQHQVIDLPDGMIALNDDFRARVVVVDPRTNRIVWQYGHTDVRGTTGDHLFVPDGIDLIPIGTHL